MTDPRAIVGHDTDRFLNDVRDAYGQQTADALAAVIRRHDMLDRISEIAETEGLDFERAFQALDRTLDDDEG